MMISVLQVQGTDSVNRNKQKNGFYTGASRMNAACWCLDFSLISTSDFWPKEL